MIDYNDAVQGTIPHRVMAFILANQRLMPAGERYEVTLAELAQKLDLEVAPHDLNGYLRVQRKRDNLRTRPLPGSRGGALLWSLGDGQPDGKEREPSDTVQVRTDIDGFSVSVQDGRLVVGHRNSPAQGYTQRQTRVIADALRGYV